jgi:tripartite-type tricarboxylate transporter receptor subunit TctC
MQSSTRLACSATLLLTVCHAAQAYAESYPARPIRFIVGFAPGGGNDILARMVGQKLTEQLGQSVVIDNRPGAGGNVGAELVSRALPDGYTILMMSSSHPIQGLLKRGLTYDPIRDFSPVAQLANYPYLLVVHPAVKAKSVMELVALAKSRAGQLNFVSSGNGSGSHLAGELFRIASGAGIVHVPYKGTAQAITDLLGGRVQLMFSPMPAVLPQVKSGHLRALAVTGRKRSPALPDMPTVAEAGVASFEVSPWYGVLAPARTPRAIVTTLNAKIQLILKMPDIGERLAMEGAEPVASTPESFARLIHDEYAKWSKVIKQTGLTAE